MFGHQVRSFVSDVRRTQTFGKPPISRRARAIMQVSISFAILGTGLFVLLRGGYPPATEQFMSGVIGATVGYWLR